MNAPTDRGITLKVEQDEITPYLAKFEAREVVKIMLDALDDAANAAEDAAKDAYAGDSFPFSKTGRLQASIQSVKMKDTSVYGFVTGPQRKRGGGPLRMGFHRHLVEFGTKPHRIRTPWEKLAGVPKDQGSILHPGARPHPWMSNARDRIVDAAEKAAQKFWERELG